MGKFNKLKVAALTAAVMLPTVTFAADSDAGAAMTDAATKIGALAAGVIAIGAAIIGLTVVMKSYIK